VFSKAIVGFGAMSSTLLSPDWVDISPLATPAQAVIRMTDAISHFLFGLSI
jgi:hypothetical protein